MIIENNSSTDISAWKLDFEGEWTIDNLWNGKLLSNKNYRFSVKGAENNGTIYAGDSVSFNFTGTKPAQDITLGFSEGEELPDMYEDVFRNYKLSGMTISTDFDFEIDTILDSDEDGLPDYIETEIGSNPYNPDTDGDGLSDGIEYYLFDTDPTKTDTDGNGISDADEDFDEDGLTNGEEIDLGTSPLSPDTDSDDLSDYEEVYVYNTDPLKSDTDSDRLSDGEEIVLGTDPLNPDTNGNGILDGDEDYTISVDKDKIEDSLLIDNEAIPSLVVTGKGGSVIDVEILEYIGNEQNDELCVGKTIVIDNSNIGSGELTFSIKNEEAFEEYEYGDGLTSDSIVICYNNGVETIPLTSTIDRKNHTISAQIEASGSYFVLNMKKLIKYSNLEAIGKGVQDVLGDAVQLGGQADIVFVIDITGSMSGAIANVKRNISEFSDKIESFGIRPRFALIEFGDITCDGKNSTKAHRNGSGNWFTDVDSFKTALGNLGSTYGGDIPECAIDGLAMAYNLDMRESSEKCVVLITDANYKIHNNYGYTSDVELFEEMAKKGISVSVVTDPAYFRTYDAVVSRTRGIKCGIYGEFSKELFKISDFISEKTNEGYWIALNGLLPFVVKLDQKPDPNSTANTDGDSLLDRSELKEKTVFKMSSFMEKICAKSDVDYESMDWFYPDVEVYNYTSNPALADSDKDGLDDLLDNEPRNPEVHEFLIYETKETDAKLKAKVSKPEDYTKLNLSSAAAATMLPPSWKVESILEPTLILDMRVLMNIGSIANNNEVANEMMDHFINGKGEDYYNLTLSKAAQEHPESKRYTRQISEIVNKQIRDKGNVKDLKYNKNNHDHTAMVEAMKDENGDLRVPQPVFKNLEDITNGLGICVHGLYGNRIEITAYNFDEEKGTPKKFV